MEAITHHPVRTDHPTTPPNQHPLDQQFGLACSAQQYERTTAIDRLGTSSVNRTY